jgi:hypothetical protein
MLRRVITAPRPLLARRAFATTPLSLSAVAHDHSSHIHVAEIKSELAPKVLPRSKHQYGSSAQGDEVGARNEAAYIQYDLFHPSALQQPKLHYAVPNLTNLLTVTFLWLGAGFIGTFCWGIALWYAYVSYHTNAVFLSRPANKK